ncbi:MAG TPA: hypothetical protein VFE08_06805 [Candidatus Sulfotelmatobacter sp.]|nr:hypothetical protein [Candidatus Sulfotelmatobacter sp.]
MQILPGDQPLPFVFIFIQQDISRIRSTLLLPVRSSTFTNQTVANPYFAKQGNQESRYEFATRRSLHAGIVSNVLPNEVRWKNLLRHLRIPQPAGSRSEFMPCVSQAGAGEGI